MIRTQQTGQGLGSDIVLTVVTRDVATAKLALQSMWAQIAAFERRFSRFIVDSELSEFNAHPGVFQPISQEFHDLLVQTKRLSTKTNGLYNPFVLPALQRAGYIGSWPTPDHFETSLNYSARQEAVPINLLTIEEYQAMIPPNAALDIGGIGKGYLLDQLAESLDKQGIADYWLSLGGDLLCKGYDVEHSPWKVGIARAQNEEKMVDYITNEAGEKLAIATSGTTKRKGADWHHIIDPRIGAPAITDVLTATITMSNATAADVFATCLVILGSEDATLFAQRQGVSMILLQTEHNGTIVWHREGLPT